MFRTLIVPLDGSELAERALPYATQLAVAQHGRLILVRVAIAPPSARWDGADWEQLQVAAVAEAASYVAGIATTLRARVPVDTRVTYGRAAAGILHAVTDLAANAVVMATHGRTGLKHLMYGSVAEAVVAETSVPVTSWR